MSWNKLFDRLFFQIFSRPIVRIGFLLLLSLIVASCSMTNTRDDASQDSAQESSSEQGNTSEGSDGATDASSAGAIEAPPEPFVAVPKPQSTRSIVVSESAKDEFSKAKQAMIAKRWEDAEGYLLLMSETYPELSGVYVNLGITYERMERLEDAEKAYRFAIKTNALKFEAYTNLGVLFREQGKFQEAEQIYLDALDQWPHHLDSRINLGILYDMYLGRGPDALTQFELALEIVGGEDRRLKGWIIDIKRRMGGR
ncbi:MAG: tetratricopeptide (TPR) repeat protein [Flavobacteriales bacterium]|jgi:tetratricopeptide (TPR) repeat protein